MDHMREIDDLVIRYALDLFQTEMEMAILVLLSSDRDIARAHLDAARQRALDGIEKSAVDLAEDADQKAVRIARALIDKSFDRLRRIVQAPQDDDEGPIGRA